MFQVVLTYKIFYIFSIFKLNRNNIDKFRNYWVVLVGLSDLDNVDALTI